MCLPKNLYIVLSKTNTKVGQAIRLITWNDYNHVSISLDESLQPLYSFARRKNGSPLDGGFVEESWLRYLYRDKDAKVKVFTLPVEDKIYNEIADHIKKMQENNNKFDYDFKGLILKREHEINRTCVSFAEDILRIASNNKNLNLRNIKEIAMYLRGSAEEERVIRASEKEAFVWGNDRYYEE